MSFYGVHAVLADVNSVLGKSPYGHSLKNISEQAISHGKSAGAVSSVPFSHATPSAPASWALASLPPSSALSLPTCSPWAS
ncbi:TPA: hypothetical protein JAJ60_001008 [Corynebacterium striatum]|uniref:Uncharacterized protein n=1 Tax=Corynebacterium striatum TaxID=43770 RepID=A0ABX7DJC7_CORST|nr:MULTISPECIES: hypothetical protein [Corynebacterium]EGT5592232.1 hypothetical protein [Corynebacterium striatum]EGT5613132.1 hypothetical protein [Corynebacterium striatum]MDC7106174.1 hypothetical protein [Corynebacterium striatum]MDK7884878.1 hypothetical protein [Corynebacterium striatum]MDK8789660.1 hypothetical protein [Corynebacterium striatum]